MTFQGCIAIPPLIQVQHSLAEHRALVQGGNQLSALILVPDIRSSPAPQTNEC